MLAPLVRAVSLHTVGRRKEIAQRGRSSRRVPQIGHQSEPGATGFRGGRRRCGRGCRRPRRIGVGVATARSTCCGSDAEYRDDSDGRSAPENSVSGSGVGSLHVSDPPVSLWRGFPSLWRGFPGGHRFRISTGAARLRTRGVAARVPLQVWTCCRNRLARRAQCRRAVAVIHVVVDIRPARRDGFPRGLRRCPGQQDPPTDRVGALGRPIRAYPVGP